MKMNNTLKIALITGSMMTMAALVGCGGGGGGGGYVDSGVTIIDNTDPGYNSGTIGDGSDNTGSSDSGSSSGGSSDSGSSGGSSSGGSGTCDASGCNSFGTGGSKNTALRMGRLNQAQIALKAQAVASQFDMSLDAATQLTQLANQVAMMKQQGQMTEADRDAVIANAFGIAGVTSEEVNNAIAASQSGDNSALNSVLDKAAVGLGMPSGATMRDKILPLFGNGQ